MRYWLIATCIICASLGQAQQPFVPFSTFTQYEVESSLIDQEDHPPIAIRPWVASKFDLSAVRGYAKDTLKYYYAYQTRLFRDHLVQIDEDKVSITLDPLFDFAYGLDDYDSVAMRTNTRGFLATANIDDKVQFSTVFKENLLVMPRYERNYTDSTSTVMGWGRSKRQNFFRDAGFSQAWVSINAASFLRLTLGHGKHSFGHGHRQLLLSDNAPQYPYASADLWLWQDKLQYRLVYAELQSLARKPLGEVPEALFKEKNATFQMLSFRPVHMIELGLIHASMWQRFDEEKGTLPFNYESIIPIPAWSSLRYGYDSPGVRSAIAFNAALEWKSVGRAYGQVLWSQTGKPTGLQAGAEVFDLWLPKLHLAVEFNQIEPFAYASSTNLLGFNHLYQPLASPIGSHSKEWLGKLAYRHKRWFVHGQYNYINRFNGASNDPDFTLISDHWPSEDQLTINFAELKLGYLFNPSYNLQIYVRLMDRNARGNDFQERAQVLMLGVSTALFERKSDF